MISLPNIFVLWSQTQTRLQYDWPLDLLWMIVICALVGIGLTILLRDKRLPTQQRVCLGLLRVGAMLVLIVMLPGWSFHEEQTGKPDVIVLVDTSLSMGFEDNFPLSDLTQSTRYWLSEIYGDEFENRIDDAQQEVALPRHWLTNVFLDADGAQNLEGPGSSSFGMLEDAKQEYELHVYEIDEFVRQRKQLIEKNERGEAKGNGRLGSALGKGIVEVLQKHQGKSVAAIVLLTDGRSNIGISLKRAGEMARQLAVPILVPQVTGKTDVDRIQLVNPSGPTRVHIDQPALFEIDVMRLGDLSMQDDLAFRVESEGQQREVQVSFEPNQQVATLSLRHAPVQAGEQTLRVEYVSEKGRDEGLGNRRQYLDSYDFTFEATDDSVSVLLIEQFPRFEFRALQDLLSRATTASGKPRFELATVLGAADPQLAQENRQLLTSLSQGRDWLFEFDVIIVGDVSTDLLTLEAQSLLVEYVQQRGGGLVFVAGDRFLPMQFNDQPLAELFPADVENFEERTFPHQPASLGLSQLGDRTSLTAITESTQANRQAWQQLPGPFWLTQSPVLQTGVQVLVFADLESKQRVPLITQQFSGAGRVIFQGFDASWRWKQQDVADDAHSTYWTQLVNYLAGAADANGRKGVELSASAEQIVYGDQVEINVRFRYPVEAPADDSVVVELSEEAGQSTIVRLARDGIRQGAFTATLSDLRVGLYKVSLVSPVGLNVSPVSITIDVTYEPKDQLFSSGDEMALRDLADVSGGQFYDLNQWSSIGEELPHGQRVVIQELNHRLLWNANWLVAIFVVLVSIEWGLRRRWYN